MEFSPQFPEEYDGTVNIMLLGDAPSTEEERVGLPLVDERGKFLQKVLDEVGFNVNSLYITNVFWISSVGNNNDYFFTSDKNNASSQFPSYGDKFLRDEWENQLYRLQDEVDMIKPDIIIALGSIAYWSLTAKTSIDKDRGIPQLVIGPVKNKFSIVIPTYSSSYILNNEEYLPNFINDLQKILELNNTPAWEWPNMFTQEYYDNFKLV